VIGALTRSAVEAIAVDPQADRAVPPTGFTARLTVFAAAAMTFLAVFVLALSLAAGRLAHQWEAELSRTLTLRISAPADQQDAQAQAALRVLETTPGIAETRLITAEEQRALLEPWFGPDLPIETLPLPRLIEIIEDDRGFDRTGLRERLAGEAPAAILDDHTQWRAPLVKAASRLRVFGLFALILIAGATAAMITLAANAALAANLQVIRVLRLVGATDAYIAGAFMRRFTLRGLGGAALGGILGLGAVFLLPAASREGGFLTGLGFQGWHWFLPLLLPLIVALLAFIATRAAALRILKDLT
jgi:cell division transport system permease protein